MSLETVKREINRFLESENPEVLVIKGAWGVGKTFTWNKLILDAKNENRIKLVKYSYVSLFGINSIDSFKFSIFEQQIKSDLIGKEPNLETFKENTASVVTSLSKKYIHIFQGLPFVKNVTPALESVSFLSLSKTLVCIDDFERKGNDLSAKDILGLVSTLKEQKHCKVVLILNDSSFEDESLDEYKTYKEKVIDIELMFNPTAEECIEISLNPKEKHYSLLREFILRLDINNIRLIKKIERLASLISSELDGYKHEVIHQALHSLVLFAWSHYVKGEQVPSPEYIKDIGHNMFGLDEEDLQPQEKLWNSVLSNYDYQTTDEFDLEIASTVESGYVNPETLKQEAEKLNEKVIAAKSDSSLEQAWRKYHDSFGDNSEEVLDGIDDSYRKNINFVSPNNLNVAVKLFRDLGRTKQADELIEFYIESRKEQRELFDLERYAFGDDIDDERLRERFKETKIETRDKRTIREVLEAISGKTSWGSNDIEVLAGATEDEYYDLFKSENGSHLSTWIRTCLKFGRFANPSETDQLIADKATKALQRIALESEINARRVAKFGIIVEGTSNAGNA